MISEIRPTLAPQANDPVTSVLLEQFQQTKTKIAIQKDGELTDISRGLFKETLNIDVPERNSNDRQLMSVSEDGQYGFVYARNKNIGQLVANGAVDLAILGTDRLVEDEVEDRVEIIASYQDRYSWNVLLATPSNRNITNVTEIRRVATQYPITARRYFSSLAMEDVEIVTTAGGTELYPYFDFGNIAIDAIIDLSVSGNSMAAHNLAPWSPAVEEVYPVLIQSQRG